MTSAAHHHAAPEPLAEVEPGTELDLDVEVPEADAAEQARDLADEEPEAAIPVPYDVNPADVIEQHREVALDEDEEPR